MVECTQREYRYIVRLLTTMTLQKQPEQKEQPGTATISPLCQKQWLFKQRMRPTHKVDGISHHLSWLMFTFEKKKSSVNIKSHRKSFYIYLIVFMSKSRLTSHRRCAGRAVLWGFRSGPDICCRLRTACLFGGRQDLELWRLQWPS